MKIYRIQTDSEIVYAKLLDDKKSLQVLDSNPFHDRAKPKEAGKIIPFNESKILSPLRPKKIIGLAYNFSSEIETFEFLKGGENTLTTESKINLPYKGVAWAEPELGVVIGKRAESVCEAEAMNYVAGFVAANDITYQSPKNIDHHLSKYKAANNLCPLGNFIETEFPGKDVQIRGYQNDKLLREGTLSQADWSISKAISDLSNWMSLYPEDIILMGTPSRVRERQYIEEGDKFRIEIGNWDPVTHQFTFK